MNKPSGWVKGLYGLTTYPALVALIRFSMAVKRTPQTAVAAAVSKVPILSVFILKDDGRFMAKSPELDLVTEMETPEEAFRAIVEMMIEYAKDYRKREDVYRKSPNRAHHKPYVDHILACKEWWEVLELIEVRHGRIHLR